MLKKATTLFVPPIIGHAYRHLRTVIKVGFSKEGSAGGQLFDGHDTLFKDLARDCKLYVEYGCGASTIWVIRNTAANVVTVDTSAEWIHRVLEGIGPHEGRLSAVHVDVGEIGSWGTPLTFRCRERFRDYVHAPWVGRGADPDLVLIDGRFRVASFLASLMSARSGTKIIFDDYVNRPHYHVVEEFCPIAEKLGRQALFVVPTSVDREHLAGEIERFLYVWD